MLATKSRSGGGGTWRELVLVLAAAVAIASLSGHAAVARLNLKASPVHYREFGAASGLPAPPRAVVFGASPAFDGLAWQTVAECLGTRIANWGVPGSSPCEWEVTQKWAPEIPKTFVVFSLIDLDDFFLCDFQGDLVPLATTLGDLRAASPSLAFSRRVLTQYPLALARWVFPPAGRSDGVMVGIRRELQALVHRPVFGVDSGIAPVFGDTAPSSNREKLSDWPVARVERQLELVRAGCLGRHCFTGPKKRALWRMLTRATQRGPVVVGVVPMSPEYTAGSLAATDLRSFESLLEDLRTAFPQVRLVRLDGLAELGRSEHFYDLIHLNQTGQQIATAEFMRQVCPPPR